MDSNQQPLTRNQKRALAQALIQHAGEFVEFWSEMTDGYEGLADVDSNQAAEQIARWLKHLPGDAWDTRLPLPDDV